MGYKKFRVEVLNDDQRFKILVKGWFGWKHGYVYTNYFAMFYPTKEEALKAIEGYKNRFTDA